jgi:hypothetical protein
MDALDATFHETAAEPRTTALPLAQLSIEVGHLYMEDFEAGREQIRRHFHQVKPWVDAARLSSAPPGGRHTPRTSTCFLIDDYFTRFSTPAEVIPQLLAEARECGIAIDYLARESACAEADGVPLARITEGMLVEVPPRGSNGSRPPVGEIGWLSNGRRSPSTDLSEAMSRTSSWTPPLETSARRHSVFLDIELWDENDGRRTWSCPFLAAVWQLLRLGLLRDRGAAVLRPQPHAGPFPSGWDDLPPLIQLNPQAAPFAAYRTFSLLSSRFLPVEHAVRVILEQVAVDATVGAQAPERAAREGLSAPEEIADRLAYVFLGGS